MFGEIFVLAEQPAGSVGPSMCLCPLCGLYFTSSLNCVAHLDQRHAESGKAWEAFTTTNWQSGNDYVLVKKVAAKIAKPPARKAFTDKTLAKALLLQEWLKRTQVKTPQKKPAKPKRKAIPPPRIAKESEVTPKPMK